MVSNNDFDVMSQISLEELREVGFEVTEFLDDLHDDFVNCLDKGMRERLAALQDRLQEVL